MYKRLDENGARDEKARQREATIAQKKRLAVCVQDLSVAIEKKEEQKCQFWYTHSTGAEVEEVLLLFVFEKGQGQRIKIVISMVNLNRKKKDKYYLK